MNCKKFIHPFQNDPGTSQAQRIMDELLSNAPKIDGRTLADLLDYFVQLSKQINYYDEKLNTKDWLPFFQKSLPFIITTIIKFNQAEVTKKVTAYRKKFHYRPTKAALQALVNYEFKSLIRQLNTWDMHLRNSGLPIENSLHSLIRKNGSNKLILFISHVNTAVKFLRIKPIDFTVLLQDDEDSNVWGLTTPDLYGYDSTFVQPGKTKRQRMIDLYDAIADLATPFLDIIHAAIAMAELSLPDSFEKLRDDLKQKHTPHLALLFAFLKLFQHLQNELNDYTRKHLDFFYQKVLKLIPRAAVPDQAHIIFDIRKQLDTYVLKSGVKVIDGKDNNKEDILFALDEDLVINKAQVKDLRTVYVNNQFVRDNAYIQGVYIAPVANKAEGVEKDFLDGDPKSWPTVGGHYSKYVDPENGFLHPYPNARIAFVMASPVLLLNEGERTISIHLTCTLKQNYCLDLTEQAGGINNPCCDNNEGPGVSSADLNNGMPALYDPDTLYSDIQILLNGGTAASDPDNHHYSTKGIYYYINQDLVAQAVKLGISKDVKDILKGFLTIKKTKTTDPGIICYCEEDIPVYEAMVTSDDYENAFPVNGDTYSLLLPIFPPQSPLNIAYSGEKAWIIPKDTPLYTFGALTATTGTDHSFVLSIKSTLHPDEPGVTFYNKDALKEDIDTVMPVVKIELNDKIKLFEIPVIKTGESCCQRKPDDKGREVSLYHFFRNVLIDDTNIEVGVCGLKNFIVQNDESLQDVNKPVYPFGTRPAIVDFDVVNPRSGSKNLVGPNFYIGSKEVLYKKWKEIHVNLNWKDKPEHFDDYYKAYLKNGLDETKFEVNLSLLENGKWGKELGTDGKANPVPNPSTGDFNRQLFVKDPGTYPCNKNTSVDPKYPNQPYLYSYIINNTDFNGDRSFGDMTEHFTKYDVNSKRGFLRFQLQNQDFLQKDYAYVLARQMMAFGKLPDAPFENAIYYDQLGQPIVFSTNQIAQDLQNAAAMATNVEGRINTIDANAGTLPDTPPATHKIITGPKAHNIRLALLTGAPPNLLNEANSLAQLIQNDVTTVGNIKNFQAIIPNEPWTPIIQNISIDYSAAAKMSDIDLIHLYPFNGTYKKEELQLTPPMFPTFCDEGTLYIGLENVKPGSNVSFLFQLAEATSDTEDNPEDVQWHYLDNNIWKILRTGFEVLEDNTHNLSTTGIVKFSIPGNISNTNTVLPSGLYWIKATIGNNSSIISETIAIYTQAVRTTFTNTVANDKLRLAAPLKAGELSKLNEADANVKLVYQPFDSFGGRVPESESYFYVRVSEMLRHKNRAIQKFDYERLALDACPQIFKAKCINHSFALNSRQFVNDYPMAPGYVMLAVIPDFKQMNPSGSFEPRVPLSLLEDLAAKLRQLTSPFVRLRVMNPRYEKVDFCLRVKLLPGKDESYYKEKLKIDIRTFMAPWSLGSYDKFDFGQVINRSDIIRFLEGQDYLDYITEFLWRHDEDEVHMAPADQTEIYPITPRSILIAGHVDVCIVSNDCPEWDSDQKNSCKNQPEKIIDRCRD